MRTFTLADAPLYRVPDDPESEASRRITGVMPLLTGVVLARWALLKIADRHFRQPRPTPLNGDRIDAHADTPDESAARAEERQRAAEAVADALERLDDRRHFVLTASFGIGREAMSIPQLSAWLIESPSRIIGLRSEAEDQVRRTLAG